MYNKRCAQKKGDDIVDKYKKTAIKNALFLNRKKIKILASLTTLSIISGVNFYYVIDKNEKKIIDEKIMEYNLESSTKSNDKFLQENQSNNIIVANFATSIKKDYIIQDNHIIDSNDKEISITDSNKNTYFYNCKLSEDILRNINLKDSNIESLGFNSSAVGDYVINYLPKSLRYLSFRNCSFISDLSKLPSVCPNIEELDLNLMSSLTDLNFLYEMPNLKRVEIKESTCITTELLDYLKNKGIKNNLGLIDVANSTKIDQILKEIIKPNMSDSEKIKAITLYVINNMDYNINDSNNSNKLPLTYSLSQQKGVCTGYAYLTNVLLNKVGIKSYKVINDDHAWNMINLDGKYYYLDPTNIKNKEIYKYILDKLGLAKNYMIDTESTFNTCMTSPSDNKTIIPIDLINDIASGRSDKSLIEKYGANVINDLYYIGSILAGIFTFLGILPIISTSLIAIDTYLNIKEDYYDEMEGILIKNLE